MEPRSTPEVCRSCLLRTERVLGFMRLFMKRSRRGVKFEDRDEGVYEWTAEKHSEFEDAVQS